MGFWRHSLVISTLFVLSFCREVSYSELEALGVSCNYLDTCNTSSANRDASRRNCECDRECTFYGDCCLDAPKPTSPAPQMSSDLVCSEILPNVGYYTIGKCMRGWRDAEVRRKCEDNPDVQDPFTFIPVTAITTFVYKNQYCAACNRVRDTLSYWKLGVNCPGLSATLDNYTRENLIYDRNEGSWGVYVEDRFYRCYMEPVEPKEKRFLRACYPNLISECPSSWRNQSVREKCGSYTAYLHTLEKDVTYRNVHCALCNNVRPDHLSCGGLLQRDFERGSFSNLFDINLEKGNLIGGGGFAPKCKEGEAYDTAFKRCQKLSCGLPFLVLRNGRCVPKNKQ